MITAIELAGVLLGYRFLVGDEADLQGQIARVLTDHALTFEREARLSERDRIDFLLRASGIGLEVKVDGSRSSVLGQLWRYAECQDIQALLLVSTRFQHVRLRGPVLGKPLFVVWVTGGLR